MQNTKHCKEENCECRKVTFSYLKGPKHSRNHGQKIAQFSDMKILILNKKNTRHFNISQIEDISHWKKVNSKKEKVWEASCSPKLHVKILRVSYLNFIRKLTNARSKGEKSSAKPHKFTQ